MTGNKIRRIILILGAVFACTAPFIHILYPKTHPKFDIFDLQVQNQQISQEEYKTLVENLKNEEAFFGFKNKRLFWFVAGKPFAMFYFALLLIYVYPFISLDSDIKKAVRFSAILFTFISSYFIVWTLWYRGDFPQVTYYIAIGFVSILSTVVSMGLINHNRSMLKNIHSLLSFIVVDIKSKYISAEDKRSFIEDYTDEIEKLK